MLHRFSRRDFLKYCSIAAGALGLSAGTLMKLENALAKDATSGNGILEVMWLDGAACTGCSVSFLNEKFYTTPDDLLINRFQLAFHKTVMAAAGSYIDGEAVANQYGGANALAAAQNVFDGTPNGFVLIVEGAIQTATPDGGSLGDFCHVGDLTGQAGIGKSMIANVRAFANRAAAVIGVGTCASFGGIPAARGNVTGARGLLFQGTAKKKGALNDPSLDGIGDVTNAQLASKAVINIPGCPPHPDWIVGTISGILDTNVDLSSITLDAYKRPVDFGYKEYQCNAGPCVWRYNNTGIRAVNNNNVGSTDPNYTDANRRYPVGDSRGLGKYKWTRTGVNTDLGCLGILGCKGRKTKADCSRRRWNTDTAEEYGVNWCVGSRGNCQGCTEPTFPDKVGKFYTFA